MIDKYKTFLLKESLDISFEKKILKSLNYILGGYYKLPIEIKSLIKFDQIPLDIYQKIYDYFEFEKKLSNSTYIDFNNQKLKDIGKKTEEEIFLGMFGFIELIGLENINDKYNTIDLYNRMLDEIRSLPDIKNSDDFIRDYNIFRKILAKKDSPSKDLGLVIGSRFQKDFLHFNKIINKFI
jgi:hypothetical protein